MSGVGHRWGWHELDARWAARLVALAEVDPGDLVVDVGAGTGAITGRLVDAGARVVAVELHSGRAAGLRRRFASAPVTVVEVDAADVRFPRTPFHVVANPPFAITTTLLRRLTSPRSNLVRATLVLPAWATARWVGGRGVGGTRAHTTFVCAAGPRIPDRAFAPPAPSPVRVLRIARR